jgi:CIC family chloride channel protein
MNKLRAAFEDFEYQTSGKWILLASLVGAVAGLGAIAFQWLTATVINLTLVDLANFLPGEAAGEHRIAEDPTGPLRPWMIVVIMTLGGLVSGLLVFHFAPEAEGHGTDAAIDAFHNKRGAIRSRVPLIKTLASAVTLGTGGSAGREGPIAQIGAGFGSWLAARIGLSARDRRIMLAAGMGAGVGAIFRAPLAGALFAAEILYSDADLESDVIVPATTASIVAYGVFTQSLPAETRYVPVFGADLAHSMSSPLELVPYAILALVLAVAGAIYVQMFYGAKSLFERIPIFPHLRPAIGACAAGLVGWGLYELFARDHKILSVLGTGYGTLQHSMINASEVGIPILVTVAVAKMFTTALTISSGGSGGVFGPSMVIGGCTSAAVGIAMQSWWPAAAPDPEAFAVVGMAGFFSGIARAPVSTVIMVRAMTGDYALLVPAMLVSTLCFLACSRVKLYRNQVATRIESPAHRGDFIVDVLEGLQVRDVFHTIDDLLLIRESETLDQIVHRLPKNRQHFFPVIDQSGTVQGIFTSDDVREYLYKDEIWQLAIASDIMRSDFLSVTPEDDLNTALRRITERNLDELPVIQSGGELKLVGLVSRRDIIAAYNNRLAAHRKATL